MPHLLSPQRHSLCARTMLIGLAAGLLACASDDAIKDQASGELDKSPAKWSEPGAKADPPVVREAGVIDPCDAGGAIIDPQVLVVEPVSQCSVTLVGGPSVLEVRYLSVEIDNQSVSPTDSDGYRLVGRNLTFVGKVCEILMDSVPTDAGTDAGRDAGTDAGTDAGSDAGSDAGRDASVDWGSHSIQIGYGSCINP